MRPARNQIIQITECCDSFQNYLTALTNSGRIYRKKLTGTDYKWVEMELPDGCQVAYTSKGE